MNLTKPLFWKSKNIISILLLPLTIITLLINISKRLYSKKKFPIKTICVGNIFLGGTGKTSLTMEIEKLLGKKFKTVFIKKDYQNQMDEINLLRM
jgi:tetraacyldisaccharide 4'-kinase